MTFVSSPNSTDSAGLTRPMVKALFVASCLLAIVSWYTTFEGMRLYLSIWFSALASIGVQTALVMVAWLIGFSSPSRDTARRSMLIGVYAITAIISIAFSYTSLYTWFSARERPGHHRAQASTTRWPIPPARPRSWSRRVSPSSRSTWSRSRR